jgi:hypothetical protein
VDPARLAEHLPQALQALQQEEVVHTVSQAGE